MSRRVVFAGAALAAVAAAGTLIGPAQAGEKPKRVTGVSSVLDTMRTGDRLGPGIVYGLVLSTAGSALPTKGTFGPADPVVQQVGRQVLVTATAQGATVSMVSKAGDSGIAQTENAVQPLAVLNAPANQVIDAAAGALDTVAQTFGPQIQPFDTTAKQVAELARSVEASPGG
jgi:hypothetical protein